MSTSDLLIKAIEKRESLIKPPYETAFRLLNGFSEGIPEFIVEIFGKTVVVFDHGKKNSEDIIPILRKQLPWLEAGVVKKRHAQSEEEENGVLVFGDKTDTRIKESGVWYALHLTLNKDASFYLDTKGLRQWVSKNLVDKTVLNTFAYTGSIGVAALMGGAKEVMHLDLNGRFLGLAKRSTDINQKLVRKGDFQIGDFWSRINQYKKSGKTFDCVILDPPVFSKTRKGTIDITKNYKNIINKVRPLIENEGYLITVHNALFQSGEDHQAELNALCKDGYLSIETIIPVPFHCIGDAVALKACLPADPAPYNHSTKITVLRVKKKLSVVG